MISVFRKQSFQFCVSLLLVGLLVRYVDLKRALEILQSGDSLCLLASFFCIGITRILMPLKWQILFSSLRVVSLSQAFRIYTASSFMGQFLPSTVGGDLSRVLLLSRKGFSFVLVATSIIVERLIGLLVALLAGMISVIILFRRSEDNWHLPLEGLLVSILTVFVGLFGVLLIKPLFARVLQVLANRLRDKVVLKTSAEAFIKEASEGFSKMVPKLPLFTVLTIFEYCLAVMSVYFCAVGFRVPSSVSFWLMIPIYFLIIRLPIAFSGIGLHELGLLYLLARLGVPAETGFAVGFVHHMFLMIAVLPGAFFLNEKSSEEPRTLLETR